MEAGNLFTQEMHDNNIAPVVGSEVVFKLHEIAAVDNKDYVMSHNGDVMVVTSIIKGDVVCLVSKDLHFSIVVNNAHYFPLPISKEKLQLEGLVNKYVDNFFAFSDPRMAAKIMLSNMQKNGDLREV